MHNKNTNNKANHKKRNTASWALLFWLSSWLWLPRHAHADGQPPNTSALFSDANWTLFWEEPETKIYTKQLADSPFAALKVTADIHAPLTVLLAVIADYQATPEWVYLCKEVKILTPQSNPEGFYSYIVNALPWPIKTRDLYVKNTLTQNTESLAITFHSTGVPDYGAPHASAVRIQRLRSRWTLTPQKKNLTRIEFIGHAEPGGFIPAWVANWVLLDMPRATFHNLRLQVKKQKYQRGSPTGQQNFWPNNIQLPKP